MRKDGYKYLAIACIFLVLLKMCATAEAGSAIIELHDNRILVGEILEVYEDNWYWENKKEDLSKSYILMFSPAFKNKWIGRPASFHFFKQKKIKRIISIRSNGFPSYKKFLEKHKIYLSKKIVKNSRVIMGDAGYHKNERMLGNFAYDLVDDRRKMCKNDCKFNSDFHIYGRKIKSPVSGKVVSIVNDQVDNPVNDYKGLSKRGDGNYMIIQIKGAIHIGLAHLKRDSIRFSVGERVKKGDVIGRVGNSGRSLVPHLHYTLYLKLNNGRYISIPNLEHL